MEGICDLSGAPEILIQRLVPFKSTTARSLLANVKPVTGQAVIGAAGQ
jgi:hypothetical protein